ncbi:MAG: hypothetical protein GWO24_22250, partial [Akkermansiaceae bacterium]|nr:hypothetical protein [Akkermansiaceae bacterium]
MRSGRELIEPVELRRLPHHLRFTLDGKSVLMVMGDSVHVWDIRPGAARPNLLVHGDRGDQAPLVRR